MSLDSKLLKTLIIFFWISFLMVIFAAFLDGPEVYAAEDSLGMDVIPDDVAAWIALAVLVPLFYSTIALYKLKPIGRPLFLVTTLLSIGLSLLMGYTMMNPFLYTVDATSSIISGAILLLVYSAEGRKLFVNEKASD